MSKEEQKPDHETVEPSEQEPSQDHHQDTAETLSDAAPEVTTPEHDNSITPAVATDTHGTAKKKFNFKAFIKTTKGKVVLGVVAFLLVVGVIFAIPASRYAIAGLVIKKDVTILVLDSKSSKPVSGAQVAMNGQTTKTDVNGQAHIAHVPVGNWDVIVTKTYYSDSKSTQLVPILPGPGTITGPITLTPTGRVVPVSVTNKVSGAAIKGVEITAGDATAITGEDGTVNMVLPADKATVNATFKANNYNSATTDIAITEQKDAKNSFTLTPSGKVYFLSKRTGKINVMKSDLDGANATVAVAATGKEDETQTVLLASRDWKYLALQAKRDSVAPKLYLINTATDMLTVIDEAANVGFTPIGWSGENFIYKVERSDVQLWQPKQQSIKSFNASTAKIVTLDDTDAVGTSASWGHETYPRIYIINDQVVYAKYWDYYSSGSLALLAGKKDGIYSVKATGDSKQTAKDFTVDSSSYIDAVLYRPDEIYFRVGSSSSKYLEYKDGKVSDTSDVNDNNFYNQTYATYLVSPSGKYTFWYESRDGKNVSFVGDAGGANGKEVLADNDFKTYGWYSDDYVLLSKKDSELFVLPRDNVKNVVPLKVTDYHKPAVSFPGYGYGYGGGN